MQNVYWPFAKKKTMTQDDALDRLLRGFCIVYNTKHSSRITVEQFDILHEFVHYLKPIEDVRNKKLIESGT